MEQQYISYQYTTRKWKNIIVVHLAYAYFVLSISINTVSAQWLVGGIPNTPCPLDPCALSEPYGRQIPRDCIQTNRGRRCYYTYIPDCAGTNSPLIYDNHGYISCPMASTTYTGWKELADEKCMVVVWPVGNVRLLHTNVPCWAVPADLVGMGDDPIEEVFPCCCKSGATRVNSDETQDLYFLRSIAKNLVQTIPVTSQGMVTIDTKRIYMAGHSNGCMVSMAMAMKHSDLVAAVCCHAGSILSAPANNYIPTPIWFAHGKLDEVLPFISGKTENPGPQESFQHLSLVNGCNTSTTVEFYEDGEGGTNGTIGTIQTALGCTNDARIEFMALNEATHRAYKGLLYDFDSTAAAWNFCSSYESAVEPNLD